MPERDLSFDCITGLFSGRINFALIAYSKCPLNLCFLAIYDLECNLHNG